MSCSAEDIFRRTQSSMTTPISTTATIAPSATAVHISIFALSAALGRLFHLENEVAEKREETEAGLETPLGKFYLKGAKPMQIMALGFCALAAGSYYGITWADAKAEARHKQMVESQQVSKEFRDRTDAQLRELKGIAGDTRDQMQVMNYILSLPESERQKLNLMKPPKLYEMQR